MQLKSLFYFSSVVAVVFGATFQDVMTDLNGVHNALATLDNDAHAFSGSESTPADVLSYVVDAANMLSAIDTATNDAKTISTLSVTDGTEALTSVKDIFSIITDILTQVIAKEPGVEVMGLTSVAREILNDFRASIIAFGDAIVKILPLVLQPQANTLENGVNAAFGAAIAAYA